MNLILSLKEFWRRRLLVALSMVFAATVAVLAVYQVGFSPPSISQRAKVNAHGSIEILVDSARSPIADAQRDLTGLTARAGVFARLIAGGNVVGQIAKETGIPVKQIDVAGPTPFAGEAPGVEPVQIHPYGIAITPSEQLPILNVETRAPTVDEARALAAAAPAAVRKVVESIQTQQETPEARRVEFRVLGPAGAAPVDDALGKKAALALFVVVLSLCLLAILGVPRLISAWRDADSETPQVDPQAGQQQPELLHLPPTESASPSRRAPRRPGLASDGSPERGVSLMEFVRTLKILLRRRRLVAVGAVIAVIAAMLSVYQVGLVPPSLTSRTNVFATASTQILVDTPDSAFANLADDVDPLNTRASVFARFLASPVAIDLIAREAKLPADAIEGQGPYEQNLPLFEQEPTAEKRSSQIVGERALYRLRFENNPDLPIISVFAQAPTADEAVRLASAVPAALSTYIERIQAEQQTPAKRQVDIRELGKATGGVVNGGVNAQIAVLVFIVVMVGWCMLLIPAQTIARGWRDVDLEDGSGSTARAGGDRNGALYGEDIFRPTPEHERTR